MRSLPGIGRLRLLPEIEKRVGVAAGVRVAVLASGGMSHYPGTARYYERAYDFDRWCIQELENSHEDSFLDLFPEQLDEVGNTEMLPWAMALGTVGKQHLELLSYQPTTHHGHAVVRFHEGEKPNAAPSHAEIFSFRYSSI